METQDQALNKETDSPADSTLNGSDSSPPEDVGMPVEVGSLISTTEFEAKLPAEKAEENETDEPDKTEEAASETADREKPDDEKMERFDKHPRFQQLNNTIKDQADHIARLTEKIERLQPEEQKKPDKPTPAAMSILSKSADEIRDAMDENPQEFLSDLLKSHTNDVLAQIEQRERVQQQQQRTKSFEESFSKTVDAYAERHDDFWDMWDSGELKQFMDANPGHSAISAHAILTEDKRQEAFNKKLAEETAKIRKQAEAEAIKNTQLKRRATTMTAGTSAPPGSGPDEELLNPEKHGGMLAVFARRSKERLSGKAP